MVTTPSAAQAALQVFADKVQTFKTSTLPRIVEVGLADRLTEAARRVGESWSGSWAGYHARLYYTQFQRPPLTDMFDVEWGGLHGIGGGWAERSPEEVKAAIEKLADVSVEAVDKPLGVLKTALEDLRTEAVVALSALHGADGLDDEIAGPSDVESRAFGTTRAEYVASVRPGQIVSRDSRAVFQGMVLPAHLFYEAIGVEASSMAEAASEFLRLLERFSRQAEIRVAIAVAPQTRKPASSGTGARTVFLVHGHDIASKERVGRFLEKLELTVIVLHEQPDGGGRSSRSSSPSPGSRTPSYCSRPTISAQP